MSRKMNSLVVRIWVLASLSVVVVSSLIFSTSQWIFERSIERSLDAHLAAFTDLLASRIEIKSGSILLAEDRALLDQIPRHWQISVGGQVVYRSPSLQTDMPLLPIVVDAPQRLSHVDADGTEIVALQSSFLYPENVVVTMSFGLRREAAESYRLQERAFLEKFVYRMLAAVILVLFVLALLVGRAVSRPLQRIGVSLQRVRSGEQQRIEQAYPSEIQELADELNQLLDSMTGLLERQKTFSANIAHALKTPLAVIKNESDAPLIQERVRVMLGVIDRNLARASSAAAPSLLALRTPVAPIVQRILDGFGKVYARETEFVGAETIQFLGDEADLFELLGNVIENACKFGERKVRVSLSEETITIEDDGPGIGERDRQKALAWGARLDETAPGTGIGLAIAKDLTELYQGSIELGQSELGGLKVSISLPLSP